MATKQYILSVQEHFNFPKDILSNYLYKHIGKTVNEYKKIIRGVECEVYDIGKFIVKIRRKGEVPFDCIKWAVDKCIEHKIKVPGIIHCGKISDTASEFDILVEEKIQGECIRPDLYEEAGAELKKLHNISVDGFWKMYEPGKFYMQSISYDDEAYNTELYEIFGYFRKSAIYETEVINHIEWLLQMYHNLETSPVLLHGDYNPRHILGEEHLNGIIDFGDFQGGSIYIDLVDFYLNSNEKYYDKFLKGYGEIDQKKFILTNVHTLLWNIIDSKGEEKEKYEQKLRHTIETSRYLF